MLGSGGSGQIEDDVVEGSSLGDLPVNTCGTIADDEGEPRVRGDELTYTTLGGTRVVSNTKFLTARKLNLGLANERRMAIIHSQVVLVHIPLSPPPVRNIRVGI